MDSRLETLKKNLESAIDGMSSEQLKWHPPGKWCAEQVLEHLYQSYAGTINGFERLMKAGQPLATRASVSQRVQAFVVVGAGYMPPARKAPAAAEPKGVTVEKVRNDIGAKLVAMDATIAECEARFGGRVRVLDHPILGPLSAMQWRKLHVVHGRHHLKQLAKLREESLG
jgi:hypothetical protein